MKHIPLTFAIVMLTGTSAAAQDIPLSKILVAKEDWRPLFHEVRAVTYLEGMPNGDVAVNQDGEGRLLTKEGKFIGGPLIYHRITAKTALASSRLHYRIKENDSSIACFKEGKQVHTLKLSGLKSPACLYLWPDEGHLVVGESDGAYLWAVRIEKDGSFGPGDRYYSLRTKPNEKLPVAAMTMDAGFLLYACTPIGIQVFDPTGRLSGVLPAPSKDPMTAITIGGAKADELFVAAGAKIFARRIQGKAPYTLKKN